MNISVESEKQRAESLQQSNRVFVILNPVAGTTDPNVARQTVERFCEEHHWQCEIHETRKDEDLRKLVRNVIKKGIDIIIAAGGDGTVSGVVSGMVNSEIPMGIIPSGTGNALARDLAIPIDLSGSLKLMGSDHNVQKLDVMEVSDADKKDFYVMNVSIGISSTIMRKTGRKEKRRFGFLAYIYNGIGSVLHSDMHHFRVKVDGKPYRFSATEVMIANCTLMGLQPQIEGVKVDPEDSRLDMFIVRAKSLRGYLDVLIRFVWRSKSEEDRNLRYLEARKTIEIQSEVHLPIQADGELIGKTPVTVHLVPGALRVIVPDKDK